MHYSAFLYINCGLKWVPSHPNVDGQSLGNYVHKIHLAVIYYSRKRL